MGWQAAEREMVLAGLYQMESDGIVVVSRAPNGEELFQIAKLCAIEPMVRRRFEVVV